MIAAPPMPKSPASSPATTPATKIATASPMNSPTGMPRIIVAPGNAKIRGKSSGRGGLREVGASVQHLGRRFAQHGYAGAGLHRFGREMPAERARARQAIEETEHMARDGVQPRAV